MCLFIVGLFNNSCDIFRSMPQIVFRKCPERVPKLLRMCSWNDFHYIRFKCRKNNCNDIPKMFRMYFEVTPSMSECAPSMSECIPSMSECSSHPLFISSFKFLVHEHSCQRQSKSLQARELIHAGILSVGLGPSLANRSFKVTMEMPKVLPQLKMQFIYNLPHKVVGQGSGINGKETL